MNELREIEKFVAESRNGRESFDAWSREPRRTFYHFLVKEFVKNGINCFVGENGSYLIYHRNGRNGLGGMDEGYPNAVIVQKVKYEIPEIPEKKESIGWILLT